MKNRVLSAIKNLKIGKMIVLMDNDDREGEADVIISAKMCTTKNLQFMTTKCMGVICVAVSPKILNKLKIPLMVKNNSDKFQTGFTTSVDYKHGTTTGVSFFDRIKTIKAIVNKKSLSSDFTRPGHIFPLRGNPQGLKSRQGHTEASLYLMKLAGLTEAAVICEILNKGGRSSNRRESYDFAKKYNLSFLRIEDLLNRPVA